MFIITQFHLALPIAYLNEQISRSSFRLFLRVRQACYTRWTARFMSDICSRIFSRARPRATSARYRNEYPRVLRPLWPKIGRSANTEQCGAAFRIRRVRPRCSVRGRSVLSRVRASFPPQPRTPFLFLFSCLLLLAEYSSEWSPTRTADLSRREKGREACFSYARS